jgi:hypothetical protein
MAVLSVVRGGDLDPDILSEDAVRYHSIYGVYGISVFAVRDATIDELAQQAPLVRWRRNCDGRAHRLGSRPRRRGR